MNSVFAAALSIMMSASVSGEAPQFTDHQEITCLATNMYWEARNQDTKGQMAVGHVVMNRVYDDRFPNTVCEVVMQGPTRESWKTRQDPSLDDVHYPVRHRCQFSWYCDGKGDEIPEADMELYMFLVDMAFKFVYDQFDDFTRGATHYHADYVSPEWRHTKTRTIQVGDHIFYRWEYN